MVHSDLWLLAANRQGSVVFFVLHGNTSSEVSVAAHRRCVRGSHMRRCRCSLDWDSVSSCWLVSLVNHQPFVGGSKATSDWRMVSLVVFKSRIKVKNKGHRGKEWRESVMFCGAPRILLSRDVKEAVRMNYWPMQRIAVLKMSVF